LLAPHSTRRMLEHWRRQPSLVSPGCHSFGRSLPQAALASTCRVSAGRPSSGTPPAPAPARQHLAHLSLSCYASVRGLKCQRLNSSTGKAVIGLRCAVTSACQVARQPRQLPTCKDVLNNCRRVLNTCLAFPEEPKQTPKLVVMVPVPLRDQGGFHIR